MPLLLCDAMPVWESIAIGETLCELAGRGLPADPGARGAGGGPWLLGDYSLADAMHAPVVLRFRTYGAQLSPVAHQYVATVLADRHLQDWLAAAAAEPWTVGTEDVGRWAP